MTKFTADNYTRGFLIDDELMAGISTRPEAPGVFTAYVIQHSSGETVGVQEYSNAFEAIRALNAIPREWKFESPSQCGGDCGSGKCGKSGKCGTQVARKAAACGTGCY